MKQTIALLSFLTALLLLVLGIVAVQGVEKTQLLDRSEQALKDAHAKLEEIAAQLTASMEENKTSAESLRQAEQDKTDLATRLNDALLSSQEANEAVGMQVAENQLLMRNQQALEAANQNLRSQCELLEEQLDEAVRKNARLEAQLAVAASTSGAKSLPLRMPPTPAPSITPPPFF
ncbi:MAG: hypothetical protein IKK75_07535 [Clostridia bacterium]|nr:hypothetical protein [Clostridia bacterium]